MQGAIAPGGVRASPVAGSSPALAALHTGDGSRPFGELDEAGSDDNSGKTERSRPGENVNVPALDHGLSGGVSISATQNATGRTSKVRMTRVEVRTSGPCRFRDLIRHNGRCIVRQPEREGVGFPSA